MKTFFTWIQKKRLAPMALMAIAFALSPLAAMDALAVKVNDGLCSSTNGGYTCTGAPGQSGAGVCGSSTDDWGYCIYPDPVTATPPGECYCTSDAACNVAAPQPGSGLVSTIVTRMQNIVSALGRAMFNAIVTDTGFIKVVTAALTLYMAIYGILFAFGMAQATLSDFMVRIIKVGLIVLLLSPDAWDWFNVTVVNFFQNGLNSLINVVTAIPLGTPVNQLNLTACPSPLPVPPAAPAAAGCYPFATFDNAVASVLSIKMLIFLLATFMTLPYGPIICIILFMAIGSFVKAMLNALWVYVMAMVLRQVLFGLAPIFWVCLLFSYTRHMFDGWLNQVVNTVLQPLLLFTFFSFFAVLIQATIGIMLNTTQYAPACWTDVGGYRGLPMNMHMWQFQVWNPFTGAWQLHPEGWDWAGPVGAEDLSYPPDFTQPVFPVNIVVILTLFILTELAGRFVNVAISISQELAGAATDLRVGMESMGGALSNLTGGMGGGGGGGGAGGGSGSGGPSPGLVGTLVNRMREMTGGGTPPPPG